MKVGIRDHLETLYYHTAGDAIDSADREQDEFRKAEQISVSIVFSALTLEAYINQQYALHGKTKDLRLREMFQARHPWPTRA
jgi:hypothetical protein